MDILRIKNKYAAVALFLMLSVALQAQDYGALKYMLQKRPANERFESNKFNEHLFFSVGLGPYGLPIKALAVIPMPSCPPLVSKP